MIYIFKFLKNFLNVSFYRKSISLQKLTEMCENSPKELSSNYIRDFSYIFDPVPLHNSKTASLFYSSHT